MARKKAATKNKRAAKKESRVFRKLTLSFAAKLGVDDTHITPNNTPVSRSKRNSSAGDVKSTNSHAADVSTNAIAQAQRKAKKVARRQRQRAKLLVAANTAASGENDMFDDEYSSLVERERAHTPARSRRRGRLQRRHAIHKANNTSSRGWDAATALETGNADGASSGILKFQPATFSLHQSVSQKLDDAVSRLHQFGLNESTTTTFKAAQNPSGMILGSSAYANQEAVWNTRNPNRQASNNNSAFSNSFAWLEQSDDDAIAAATRGGTFVGGAAAPSSNKLSFQPASFQPSNSNNNTLPASNHLTALQLGSGMDDPDL